MTPAPQRVTTRSVARGSFDEVFACARFDATDLVTPGELVDELERAEELEILRVVVFGTSSIDDVPWMRRRRALVVGNQHPTHHQGLAIEVFGIRSHDRSAVHVHRLLEGSACVEVTTPETTERRLFASLPPARASTFAEQADAAFVAMERILREARMEPHHLSRTWYFLRDIATNYACFNEARDRHFDRWGLSSYPASTGIGARLPAPSQLGVMFEAVDRAGHAGARVHESSLQCPPRTYGPRFSRAVSHASGGGRVLHISGISTIDDRGRSIHGGDPDAAVHYTMESFEELLAQNGMGFAHLCSTFVYAKNDHVRAAFQRYTSRRGLSFPHMFNHVDICRPELLFEIEGRAVDPPPERSMPAADASPR